LGHFSTFKFKYKNNLKIKRKRKKMVKSGVYIEYNRKSPSKSAKVPLRNLSSFIIPQAQKVEETKIITQPKQENNDRQIKIYKRTMDDYELELLEERIAIMTICGEVPELEAEPLAVADVISLRDRSGLVGSIVNLLGGIEINNPEIKLRDK